MSDIFRMYELHEREKSCLVLMNAVNTQEKDQHSREHADAKSI
jgi:hypothetical protein